jgi:hypothetical protein
MATLSSCVKSASEVGSLDGKALERLSSSQTSTPRVSKVGEPVCPPPLISPSSDGGDVKTLLVLETELARDGACDLACRGLPVVDGARLDDRLEVEGLAGSVVVDRGDGEGSVEVLVEFFSTRDRRLEAADVVEALRGGMEVDVV